MRDIIVYSINMFRGRLVLKILDRKKVTLYLHSIRGDKNDLKDSTKKKKKNKHLAGVDFFLILRKKKKTDTTYSILVKVRFIYLFVCLYRKKK